MREKSAISRGIAVSTIVAGAAVIIIIVLALGPFLGSFPKAPPPTSSTSSTNAPTTSSSISSSSSSSSSTSLSSVSITSTISTTTNTTSSGPVYGNITVYAARVPSEHWAPCFALKCSAGTGPGASMWFDLYNSTFGLAGDGFSNENGYNFTGLIAGQPYYLYPQDCDFCHRSNHDVNFSHWQDNSTIRPLEVRVGESVTAWYKFVPLNCTFVTTTETTTTMNSTASNSTTTTSSISSTSSTSTITCNTGTGIVPAPSGISNDSQSSSTAAFVVAGVSLFGVVGLARRELPKRAPKA